MCRLVIYKGTAPIQLSHLFTHPCHSIINQAFACRLRLDHLPVNGDGFGVGWYDSTNDPELGNEPCLFKSITPAWNNSNLIRLAEKIKSPLVFGHVRASTAGSLSQDNCHPWNFKRIMWMHNGHLAEFKKIKRRLMANITDEMFNFPQGGTDSEWSFALFLSMLPDPHAETVPPVVLQKAMLDTIACINKCHRESGVTTPSLMNYCVTDGQTVVATRYVSSKHDEAASLYFSSGTTFEEYAPGGHYKMAKADKRENIIMIASEPLTFEKADWMEIKTNSLIVITPKMNVLQIPIIDEFHVSPTDPAHPKRTGHFAEKMGYLNPRLPLESLDKLSGTEQAPLSPVSDA